MHCLAMNDQAVLNEPSTPTRDELFVTIKSIGAHLQIVYKMRHLQERENGRG
jgi:hypothetical protein